MSQSVLANLRASADRFPDRAAIKSTEGALSYRSLWRRARSLGNFLRSQGVSSGDRIAILLPNSVDYAVALFGALSANAIAVPLSPLAKARDLIAWLDHSGPSWLVAERSNHEAAAALARCGRKPRVVWVSPEPCDDMRFSEVVREDGDEPGEMPQSSSPAVILFTSGTTGRPKGVVLSHGNLASNAAAIVGYLGLTENDSIVNVLPFHYSYGNSVLQSHVCAGGTVILESNFVYPHAVLQALAENRCTGFAGVPSTYALLLSRTSLQDFDLSHLRYVTQAGGPMSPELADRLRDALPRTKVIIMYGQTEATARLTYLPFEDFSRKRGSVGIPIPGVSIQIRDGSGNPVPLGEVGEVWARGANVMLGYWRDDEATRAVLRDGWLVTGDMGRLDAEGYLYLNGRRSDIIKVGAFRIHPVEVEEVIAEIPGVREVAVVGTDDEILGQVIRAFVVRLREGAPTMMQIQRHCRDHLASYKVPKTVEFVESLPKTDSGKVRRADLQSRVKM